MQKKLLSLVVIATMVISHTISCAPETVPVISPAEHADNEKRCKELVEEINASEENIHEKKKAKDLLESNFHSYKQRIEYRNKLVAELSGEKEAIKKYKDASDTKVDSNNKKMKTRDNGITAGWFGSLSDPLPDSRSGKAYARIKDMTDAQKLINKKLSEEHLSYMTTVEKDILPALELVLSRKITTMDNLVASFNQCDCYQGSEYDRCLDEEGITALQRSREFPGQFTDRAYSAVYNDLLKDKIPVTKEEIIAIAGLNHLTKSTVAKAEAKKEELRKAIAREKASSEKISEPAESAEVNKSPDLTENK